MSMSTTKRWLLNLTGIMLILVGLAYATAKIYPTPEPEYGISFSSKYADELGLGTQKTLEALLNDLEFRRLRLMSYWDVHQPEPEVYDFSELDKQFELAEKYDAEVVLAIGQRQPRWPECHIPSWAHNLSTEEYEQRLLDYLSVVVERYQDNETLVGYHLENEAANRSFGQCPEYDNQLLNQEFETVKSLDEDTPITISVSNQYGIPVRPPVADRYAMSIYRQAYFEVGDRQVYWNYSFVPPEWHRLRAWGIGLLHDRPTYVHELQTEPWGPNPTRQLSSKQQYRYMSPENIRQNVDYAASIGTETIYLWGGEWWYWRLNEFNDPGHWQTVKDISTGESLQH